MARYSVYRLRSKTLVLDCQSNFLSHLDTRFVVPLLDPKKAFERFLRLNPIFEIGGRQWMMATQLALSIPVTSIDVQIASLTNHDTEIANALDMLIIGI